METTPARTERPVSATARQQHSNVYVRVCVYLCVLHPLPQGGSRRKVTHPASPAYKCRRLLAEVPLAPRHDSLVRFFPPERATFPKVTTRRQLRSLLKRHPAHLSLTIHLNMATRWGLCGAGKISHDFSVALKTLPAGDHQVLYPNELTASSLSRRMSPSR